MFFEKVNIIQTLYDLYLHIDKQELAIFSLGFINFNYTFVANLYYVCIKIITVCNQGLSNHDVHLFVPIIGINVTMIQKI